jgi:hypothetical protein
MAFPDDKIQQAYLYDQTSAEKPVFKDGDKALEFLRTEAAVGEGEDIDERRLIRKIDFMIVPLMFCCYLLQYLDKSLRKIDVASNDSNST